MKIVLSVESLYQKVKLKMAFKCENCLGKQAKKTKGILAGIGTVVGTVVAGIVIYAATRGGKGKL